MSSSRKPPPPPPHRRNIPLPPPREQSPGYTRQVLSADKRTLHAFPPPPRTNINRTYHVPPLARDENNFAEAISNDETTLKKHETRSSRCNIDVTSSDDILEENSTSADDDLLEMAKRLEMNSSVVSDAETEDMQRSLDMELADVTYSTEGVPKEWRENVLQRERETIMAMQASDLRERAQSTNNTCHKTAHHETNDASDLPTSHRQRFSYNRAKTYGSGISPPIQQRHSVTKGQNFQRSSSEGLGANMYSVPPPSPPPLRFHHKKYDSHSNANIIDMAQHMNGYKSLTEPGTPERPRVNEYLKDLRGRKKSTTHQMMERCYNSQNRVTDRDDKDCVGELDRHVLQEKRMLASQYRKIEHEKRKQIRLEQHINVLTESSQSLKTDLETSVDDYDEVSGADISRNSDASKQRRAAGSHIRKLQHEQRRKGRMQQKKLEVNRRCQSFDRQCSRHSSRRRNSNRILNSRTTKKKKSILLTLFNGRKNTDNNVHILNPQDFSSSLPSMFDTMSFSSNLSGKSQNSKKSGQSMHSRKSIESRHSKKSTKSLRSLKTSKKDTASITTRRNSNPEVISTVHSTNSACSGLIPTLSLAADMFKEQSLPGDIRKPRSFDEAMSCSSSISFYLDDDELHDDCESDTSSVSIPMTSVTEAVAYLNSQNKIEKFVAKVKRFL